MLKTKKIQIKSNKFPTSEAINAYVEAKFQKYLDKYQDLNDLVCHLKRLSTKTSGKYSLLIEARFGKGKFIINETGNNIYQIIDTISHKFNQKVLKLHELQAEHVRMNFAGQFK